MSLNDLKKDIENKRIKLYKISKGRSYICKRDMRMDMKCTKKTRNEKDVVRDEKVNVTRFGISNREIIKKLQVIGKSIRLSGESDIERLIRLRGLERENTQNMGSNGENVRETQNIEYDRTDITPELLKNDRRRTCFLIVNYFKLLLKEWETSTENGEGNLGERPLNDVRKQTSEYLEPLLNHLTSDTIPDDILEHIVSMCYHMQKGEYTDAGNAYMKLSIGNAPWPIGITMVGIHERSSQGKTNSRQNTNILKDDTQRKWIQSVKRLLTFCQTKYPRKKTLPEDSNLL